MDNTINLKINKGQMLIIFNMQDTSLLKRIMKQIVNKSHNVEIWTDIYFENTDCMDVLKTVSKDEMKNILEFYRLYEFTDKIIVISDSSHYPSTVNYIHQGILTKDEFVEGLLYKIG